MEKDIQKDIGEIKIGDRVTEEELLSLGESEVYLKDVRYELNEKYGYSILNGKVCVINKYVDDCRLEMYKFDMDECIYRVDKDDKDLHEKKLRDGISNLITNMVFLTQAWDISIKEFKCLSEKYRLFEYIVMSTDYFNSINFSEIEFDIKKYLTEQGNKDNLSMCIDEYDVPVIFEDMICEWMLKLCLEYDWNISNALYKILDTKVFEKVEPMSREYITRSKDVYDKKKKETFYKELINELSLEV